MYINNPSSLAGFNPNTTFDELKGTVVTKGQLFAVMQQLDTKFTNLLQGKNKAGVNGFTNLRGYAWLGLDGKIDPKLMPPLATMETTVIDRHELSNGNLADINVNVIYELLNTWAKSASTAEYAALHGKKLFFQKGDLIVVSIDEEDDYTIGEYDFVACGTYIVTDVPNENDIESKYQFIKISSISQRESTYSFLVDKISQLTETVNELKAQVAALTGSNDNSNLDDLDPLPGGEEEPDNNDPEPGNEDPDMEDPNPITDDPDPEPEPTVDPDIPDEP